MEKTHKQKLEEVLPDYVLNRLNGAEKEQFEKEVKNYPDLMQEIEDAKAVFARFEAMDFNNSMKSRSSNVSVKVMNRLNSIENNRTVRTFRFLAPSFGIALIIFGLIYYPKFLNRSNSYNAPQRFEVSNINIEDINKALGDSLSLADYQEILPIEANNFLNSSELVSAIEEDVYNSALAVSLESLIDNDANAAITLDNTYDVYNQFNNISEDDFTKIYKELKNEKFPS